MNHLDSWLSSAVVRALGWTLIHFIWQGALLALLLPGLFKFLRTANARYAAGLGTLAAMGIAPMITFLVLFQAPSPVIMAPTAVQSTLRSVSDSVIAAPGGFSPNWLGATWFIHTDWLGLAVLLWFAGIAVLSLRTLGGWYVMERLRGRKAQLSAGLRTLCLQLQERLGIRRTVSFCQSYLIDAPLVIGWFRPVVLLPASALTGLSTSQIEAIIAHELAHIRRLDAFVNLFQISIETILFYHPAVWWVSHRVRMERENCCDDVAVSACGNPLDYAKALTLMETWRTAPALALGATGGSLKARISRLLGLQTFGAGVPRAGFAALALVLSAGVVLAGARFAGNPNQTLSYGEAAPKIAPPLPPAVPEAYPQPEPAVPLAPMAPSVPALSNEETATDTSAGVPEPPQPPAPPPTVGAVYNLPPDPPDPPPSASTPDNHPPDPPIPPDHSSYIDGMAAAGLNNLSVDDLIALKIQGVTPEYVRDMRATGLTFSRSQLIAMKIQGVTPEYVRHIRDTWKDVTAHDLIAMRIQGVDPADVAQFRQLGMTGLSLHDIIDMKMQGVTPDYARHVRETWKDASAHDLIDMRIQGVDPSDVAQFRQLGITGMSLHTLIEMRIQGVTPDYVRQMKDAGFSGSAHEFVEAKIQDITPEFVRTVRSHGFTNLSAHKLIQLKLAGIF